MTRRRRTPGKYATDAGIPRRVAFQTPGGWGTPVAKLYRIEAIRALLLLDWEGNIHGQFEPGDALNTQIEKALAGAAPAPK